MSEHQLSSSLNFFKSAFLLLIMEPIITNVVASANLGASIKINLQEFFRKETRSHYFKTNFNGLFLYLKKPAVTVTIFHDGKFNIAGAKSEMEARKAARKTCQRVRKILFPHLVCESNKKKKCLGPVLGDFRVVNVAASMSIGKQIHMARFIEENVSKITHEPELFNGTHLKMDGGGTATVYYSGRFYATGFRSEIEMNEKMKRLSDFLLKYT